jgi:plastocyanin
MSVRYLSALLVLLPVLLLARAAAAAEPEYSLTISDHRFQPERLEIPAGQKIRLVVENRDATPEEFESYDLNVEKVITGNQKATLYIGPLDAGTYEFFGEFHSDTARGHIVAK